MEEIIKAIQDSPFPTLTIVTGSLFLGSGFSSKFRELLEVSPEQKKLTIFIGMLLFTIGLVLHFSPFSYISGTNSSSPLPMILMSLGSFQLVSGFDSKRQKKLTISIGLLSLTIGLVFYFSPYFSFPPIAQ
jgi:uncharacterized membrane protein HdeD (DUF308 family)